MHGRHGGCQALQIGRAYIASCHEARPLDIPLLKQRLSDCHHDKAIEERACRFLDSLPPKASKPKPAPDIQVPVYPEGTHAAFLSEDGKSIIIREWDADLGLYVKTGNTLGPAIVSPKGAVYAIGGQVMDEARWRSHPEVLDAASSPASTTSLASRTHP